jgi:hypothetical protein
LHRHERKEFVVAQDRVRRTFGMKHPPQAKPSDGIGIAGRTRRIQLLQYERISDGGAIGQSPTRGGPDRAAEAKGRDEKPDATRQISP